MDDTQAMGWRNWGGNQSANQAGIVQPNSHDALHDVLSASQSPIRPAGSGHSFTALVPSDGTIVRLDEMPCDLNFETEDDLAWLPANACLHDLSPALEGHGLAFRNLGDIDVQSLAGATATGTHGTGKTLKALHGEISAVRLMTVAGDIIELDSSDDRLKAAALSLGTLGVLLEAQVAVVASHRLHRKAWVEPLDVILRNAHRLWDDNRNFEFFYIPFSGHGICLSHNLTDAPEQEREQPDDDGGLGLLKMARSWLGWAPSLRKKLLASALKKHAKEDVVGTSWKMLASPRNIPFVEMEYHLPPENALAALQSVVSYIERERRDVFFPIEVRQTAGDDNWLSPFQGGPRISVAVHAAADETYDFFFKRIEPIFREAGGRPHWGKMHSLKAPELDELYPDLDRFRAVRAEMDPDGRLLTPYLRDLLGA